MLDCCKRVHRPSRSVKCEACEVTACPYSSQLMFAQDSDIKPQRKPTSDHHLRQSSSYDPLVLWLHNSIPSESQISSSECSLSEERMLAKHRFCRRFAIRQRVRRSIGEIQTELAARYVLVPDETFDLII